MLWWCWLAVLVITGAITAFLLSRTGFTRALRRPATTSTPVRDPRSPDGPRSPTGPSPSADRRPEGPSARRDPGTPGTDGPHTIGGPLRVSAVERSGSTVGVGQDRGGWFAILELTPPGGVRPEGAQVPSPELLARAFQDGRDPSAVQFVSHTVAPTGLVPPAAAVDRSYRALADGYLSAAQRFHWVAVRLDSYDGAAVAARHGGDWAAPASATAAAVLRSGRILRAAGFGCRVLGETELLAALALAEGMVAPERRAEHWSELAVGDGAVQVTYAADTLPPSFVTAVTGYPWVSTTLSTTVIAAETERYRTRDLVRVVAPTTALANQATALLWAEHSGVRLIRLDGRHQAAAWAASPTAAAVPPAGGYTTIATAAGADPLAIPWQAPRPPRDTDRDGPDPDGTARDGAERAPARRQGTETGMHGVMVGRAAHGYPAVIRMLRSAPTEATLVGDVGTAGMLVLRAIAAGARAHLRTGRPDTWQPLVDAVGDPDRLIVGGDPTPGTPYRPVLLVDDTDMDPSAGWPPPTGWQTRLTVVRHVGAQAAHRLAASDLAILRRLTQAEADLAAQALPVTAAHSHALAELPAGAVVLVGVELLAAIDLAPTEWERAVLAGADTAGYPGRGGAGGDSAGGTAP